MSYQLESHIVEKLKSFFNQFDFIDKVVIFGSRAKHDANPKSDIDLCIYSLEMTAKEFTKLKIELDELPILYKIDIVHFEKSNDELKKNILRDGKFFFIKTVKLGNVLKYEQPTKYIVSNNIYDDNYNTPVLTAGKTFILGYTNETENIFTKTPVIIFDDFTTATKFVDFPFKVKSSAMKILNPTKEIDIQYIFYLMSTMKVDRDLHKRYWISTFAKIKIPLPSLTKQKEIAKTLDKAQELIELRKESIKKLDALSKLIFIDIFGDPYSNIFSWKIEKFDNYIDYIGDIGSNGSNAVISKNLKMLDNEDYAFMVRTTNLNKNDFSSDVKYVSKETYNFFKKSKIFGGEIIMNKIGSAGKFWIMPFLNKPVSLGLNQLVIRLKNLDIKYLFYLLSTDYGKIIINSKTNGAVTKSITKGAVKDIDIMVPPFEEQKSFALKIEVIEEQKYIYEAQLTKLQANFDALLAQSFKA